MGTCFGYTVQEGYKNPAEPDPRNKFYGTYVAQLPQLHGKVIAITGCTTGIGLCLAGTAIQKGASCLLLLNRPSDRATSAAKLLQQCSKATEIITVDCDLMSFQSTAVAAARVKELADQRGGLDVLCCNAAIMAFRDRRTDEGYDIQMQTNYLSHYLLGKLLLPSLEKAVLSRGDARIVMHQSGARAFSGQLKEANLVKSKPGTLGGNLTPMNLMRYAQTKLAQAIFSLELSKKLAERGSAVKSVSCEPGRVDTDLAKNLYPEVGCCFRNIWPCFAKLDHPTGNGMPVGDGTVPLLMCCFASETTSGDLWMPSDRNWGNKPVRPIQAGVEQQVERTEGKDEKLVVNPESQKLLWEKSEEALGPFFDNTNFGQNTWELRFHVELPAVPVPP